jgi:hypothetical protein
MGAVSVAYCPRFGMNRASLIRRVGQNHIYTVYLRYFWQGNHQIYGHIRCIYMVLANPTHTCRSIITYSQQRGLYWFPSTWLPLRQSRKVRQVTAVYAIECQQRRRQIRDSLRIHTCSARRAVPLWLIRSKTALRYSHCWAWGTGRMGIRQGWMASSANKW